MIIPIEFDSIKEKVRAGSEIFHHLKQLLKSKGFTISVGDEGGFAPKLSSNEGALDVIVEAINKSGYTPEQVKIGIDVAASSFYVDSKYEVKIKGKKEILEKSGLIDWYGDLVTRYPIVLIEDGFAEDDWQGFCDLNVKLGDKIALVGDDLLVTDVARINRAIDEKAVNSVLIKPNQIGTITEALNAIELTKMQGWKSVASHRSGETTDTFIADLAIGSSCSYIKSGSLSRGERICKYNRLMEIEDKLRTI